MGLTTEGISYQILSSLKTFRLDHNGTENDCKVVINHLIRKFSEPLELEGRQKKFRSNRLAAGEKGKKEHLMPVLSIMEILLSDDFDIKGDPEAITTTIASMLEEYLIIVEITEEEDRLLNQFKLQRKMPEEFYDVNSDLYNDLWARYKKAGIFRNISI